MLIGCRLLNILDVGPEKISLPHIWIQYFPDNYKYFRSSKKLLMSLVRLSTTEKDAKVKLFG